MKLSLILMSASLAAAARQLPADRTVVDDVHPQRQIEIDEINAAQNLWKAAPQPRFAADVPGISKSMMGVKGDWVETLSANNDLVKFVAPANMGPIPDSFDSATNFTQCTKIISDVRDQSNCGCCWAFAGAEAASDRACIATNGQMQIPLSAQDVCFCSNPDGCDGGMIDTPWSYIKHAGAVTGGQYQGTGPFGAGMCSDFSLPHCHHHGPQGNDPYPPENAPGCPSASSPQCPSSCDSAAVAPHNDFSSDKITFQGQVETASGEQQIQQMIMAGGPVSTAFSVYKDFENYAGGIYTKTSNQMLGGHAVKFVGWGVEGGVKFWKVANSWNPYWGESGYFRIKRGDNECGIEGMVVGSSADSKWGKKSELDQM